MLHVRKAPVFILVFWLLGVSVISLSVVSHRKRTASSEEKRAEQIEEMLGRIKDGTASFAVDADALPVSGEEPEDLAEESSAPTFIGPEQTQPALSECPADGSPEGQTPSSSSTLISYGTIGIPSIGCELPLWDGAGKIELRYGAGRLPLSADAGGAGNLVIFGHRMRKTGSIFNRLGEVQIGDPIHITRDGTVFTYTVDRIETVDPSLLSYYISLGNEEGSEERRITLITCTPIGIGSHRLLIIGHFVPA